MKAYYVRDDRLLQLVSERQDTVTAGPTPTKGLSWLDCAAGGPSLEALSLPRSAQSAKSFFLPAAESVGRYGAQVATAAPPQTTPIVLLGVRACELRARNYLDKVMLAGDYDDPAYSARKEATTIVSCDCVSFAESCFCTLVGGLPYATEGYDVNLTPVEGGFIAEVATEAGSKWLGESGLTEAPAETLAERERLRREATDAVIRQNAEFTFSADDTSHPSLPEGDDPAWQRFSCDCVECAACTNICPTCHCFYLYDQVLGPEQFERMRTWDSCLLGTYHRMAGGPGMKLTPRPTLSSRLANRVLHKFVYSPQQYDLLGCVGCGRCVDGCLGDIDIRRVVQELGK